ncbi:MAG TPA: BTAD domain-containing putative transcriptional regulator [Mycobacteriales bacterium]|nr:BTAD domain-containing putative transcriptional regulator [Mycobacteriales bacterium]
MHRTRSYSLQVRTEDLDATSFEEMVGSGRRALRDGRTTEAAATLRRALDMWRGDALADLVLVPALRDEVANLAAHRLTVFEDWIEAELELGRHIDVLDRITQMIAIHPMRERLRSQQMVALYRAGRQNEGLAEYDNLRRMLAAELGLEPSPALQQLYQAILSGDPALNQPAAQPPPVRATAVIAHAAGLPRDVEDFVGHRDTISTLARVLASDGGASSDRTGRLVNLSGAPGVGKTTIAVRLAHQLAEHYPDGQLLVPLRDRAGVPQSAHLVLGSILDHLGVEPADQPASESRRLMLMRNLLAERRMMLIYDNPGGEEQIRRLLPGTSPTSVLVTSRRYLGGLTPGFHQRIEPLPAGPAGSLLRSAAQDRVDLDETTVARIVACCGGLPLALRIAGIRLCSLQHLSPGRFAERLEGVLLLDELVAGDLSIRATLDQFWHDLDANERFALATASRLGPTDFDLADFVAAASTDPSDAERALDRLAECHAVQPVVRPDDTEVRFRVPLPVLAYATAETDNVGAPR